MNSHRRLLDPVFRKPTLAEIYENLYPWASLNAFVKQLKDTIAYKSEDNAFIALNKPFGVGIHTVHDNNYKKQNQDKLLSRLTGSPRYCLDDALQPLADEFKSPQAYQVIRSIDRYMSGLVLISNDPEKYRPRIHNSLIASRAQKWPPFGFRAITSGYPIKSGPGRKLSEEVGMDLIEVDELGHYKEPIIVREPTAKHRSRFCKDKYSYQVELQVKKVDKGLASTLIEVFVSTNKYDFTRCYVSSKTAFILGDVRFSKRYREILGKKIQVPVFKSSHSYDDSYEPLSYKVRKTLGVRSNASIPLMLDHYCLRLANFFKPEKPLIIESPYVPAHFALTAERLFGDR